MRHLLRNRFAALLAAALLPAALAACDDDDLTEPSPLVTADLAGTFDAERAVFTDASDPNARVPVVASGGELVMDVDDTGAFTTTIRRPGFADEVRTGTLAVDGEQLRIEEDGLDARMADFTFDRPTSTLTIEDDRDRFAFEAGEEEVRASSQIELKRRLNN